MAEYIKRYNPNRSAEWNYGGEKWKLSRSKIDLFLECPRCFYLDNKLGTKRPGFPSFNLNIAVDELFKKEFDVHRKKGTRHPLCETYDVDAIPFANEHLNVWRDNFSGIETVHEPTGLRVSGAIDDVWVTPEESLVVVDYKATSKEGRIDSLGDSPWEAQYARQLGVYRWLLEQNGFTVAPTAYLVYANADKAVDAFNDQLVFETTLVPVETDVSWIPSTLTDIQSCLTTDDIPAIGEYCEYCPYRQAAGEKLFRLHKQNNGAD